jgi:hypothetical protein
MFYIKIEVDFVITSLKQHLTLHENKQTKMNNHLTT